MTKPGEQERLKRVQDALEDHPLDPMISTNLEMIDEEETYFDDKSKSPNNPATRLRNETVWKMLVRGATRTEVMNELKLTEMEYSRAVQAISSKHRMNGEDIERERQLAHDRYLEVYRRVFEELEKVEKPQDVATLAREVRATIKEIGDIYSVKLPTRLEVSGSVEVRAKADQTIEDLLKKLRNSQEEITEAQVVEEDTPTQSEG